jgi:hypothetical protein
MLAWRLPGNATTHLVLSTLIVVLALAPPLAAQQALTIAKSFNPSTVVVGGTATTTMTVTITNPNVTSVNGIIFGHTYPPGLVPDSVGAYTCNAGSAVFTGTGWSLGNVTLGAGASCSVPILMHSTTTGPITNMTSQVTGTGVPAGGPASAILNAVTPVPMLSGWMLAVLVIAIATISVFLLRDRAGQAAETRGQADPRA